MRYLSLLFILIAFICLIFFLYYSGKDNVDKSDKLLTNNILITGRVLKIKTSNNHSFGIILLNLETSNIKVFTSPDASETYPYKLIRSKAELYTFIPDGLSIGDEVTINSNRKVAIYYYINSKQRSEGSIKIIKNNIDLAFIRQNSLLDKYE